MGTEIERASAIKDIYKRGASYECLAMVDRKDVHAVRTETAEAIARAKGRHAALLEIRPNVHGKLLSDAVSARATKEELDKYLSRPIGCSLGAGKKGEITPGGAAMDENQDGRKDSIDSRSEARASLEH